MPGLIGLGWPKQVPRAEVWHRRANQAPSALNSEAIPDLMDDGRIFSTVTVTMDSSGLISQGQEFPTVLCENGTVDGEAAAALLARFERRLAEVELANSDTSVSPNDITKFYEHHSVDYRANRSTSMSMYKVPLLAMARVSGRLPRRCLRDLSAG